MLWQKKANIKQIGQMLGRVLEIDIAGDSMPHWKKFVRLRVDIDLSSPLKSRVFLPRPSLSDVWIGLKFEKLSELCYKCGILGHAEKDCNLQRSLLSNQYGIKFPAYGDWIPTENDFQPPDIYEKIHEHGLLNRKFSNLGIPRLLIWLRQHCQLDSTVMPWN